MTSPAAARGEAVRQRLLAAAAELVPERGWPAVSTRVIADRAGVTPSVVHYHFASVQALLAEAVLAVMRAMAGEVEPVLEQARTAEEVVDALAGSVERYTGADPASLLFVEAYLAATRDDALRRGIAEILDGLRTLLGGRLRALGVPDADATAAVLAATVDGLLLHRPLSPAPAPTAVLRRLVRS